MAENQKRFTDKVLSRPGGISGRRELLAQLRQIRATDSSRASWDEYGYCALAIPEIDYAMIVRRYPDLEAPDHATREAAWAKFMRTPLAERYKPHKDVLHKNNHKVIVK